MRMQFWISLGFAVALLTWSKVSMSQDVDPNAAAKAHNAKMKICRATYIASGHQLLAKVEETGSRINQARGATQAANNAVQNAIGNFGRLLEISHSATATKQDVAATKAASEFMDQKWADGRAKNLQTIEVFEEAIAAREAMCRHIARAVADGCSVVSAARCRHTQQFAALDRAMTPILNNRAMYQDDWRQEGDSDFGGPSDETDKQAQCLIAKEHARNGQEAYGHIFDAAEIFLRDNEIDYDLYGRKRFYQEKASYGTRYKEKYCSDIHGGCGADKFEIDVSFALHDKDYPVVLITPQSGAKNTEFGYVIIGKLSGVINHKSCSDREFIDGHTWKANVSNGEIIGNINDKGYVKTSLSQAGAMIHNGYYSALLPSYEGKTLVIKIEDFGNGPNYARFNAIIDELPGSGVVGEY